MNTMIAPVVRFALETALRKQELVDLQWEWVDFERGFIHANKTKTGYVRRMPMSPIARELLERCRNVRQSPPVASRLARFSA